MPDQSQAALIIEKGGGESRVIPLTKPTYVIGSDGTADVVLTNPYVSHFHVQIIEQLGQFRVRDMGSKNGTSVNGTPVGEEGVRLSDGDIIELAQGQVTLRFQARRRTLTVPLELVPQSGELVVDAGSREVWVVGARVEPPLPRKEFDVLHLLYQRKGKACSRDDIAAAGWPERADGNVGDQEIDQCIRRLRLRIEPDSFRPRYIITVRGYGYRLL